MKKISQLSIGDELRSRVLIDNAPEAVFILDVDSGKCIDVNSNATELLKYSKEELLKIGPADLSHSSINGQNYVLLINQYLQEALDGGNPIFEWIHLDKDGIEIPCEIRLVRFPPYDQKLVRASMIDLTTRRKLEADLKASEERLKLALKVTGTGCFDWYLSKEDTLWDTRLHEIFGLPLDATGSRTEYFFTHLHPDDQEDFRKRLTVGIDPNNPRSSFSTECRIIKNEKIRHLAVDGFMFRNEPGVVQRIIGTMRDITKEKEAERQKIRSRQLSLKNKELEQFVYIASHDLQEPLRTIISFVGLLKKHFKVNLQAEANQHLELIAQSASRMSKLINGLLDYSLIGRKRELVSIDCNALLRNILKDLAAQISETDATFEIAKLPQLIGYETELRMLFQNLISNAIKFRKAFTAPLIKILAQHLEGFWQFSIVDNGIGIDPSNQERVFVIFQRLHPQEDFHGTGLGLAHCQKVVDLHGGKIWVDSQLGKGSQFHFTIPDDLISPSS